MRRVAVVAGLAALGLPGAAQAFPGTNGAISFQRGFPGDLFVISPNGGKERPLHRAGVDNDAQYSPDGQTIVFTTGKDERSPAEIATAVADGTQAHVITHHGGFSTGASYSPDGQLIIYNTDEGAAPPKNPRALGPRSYLHVMNPDGSGDRRLYAGNRDAFDAVYSPDGTQIAFTQVRPSPKRDYAIGGVMLMKADGTGAHALPRPRNAQTFNPSWSPDGKTLAVEIQYQPTRRKSDIALQPADGSAPPRKLVETTWWETNPVFSPDGSKLVFTSDRDTRPKGGERAVERLNSGFELYTVGIDGRGLKRLTRNHAPDIFPDWQPLPR